MYSRKMEMLVSLRSQPRYCTILTWSRCCIVSISWSSAATSSCIFFLSPCAALGLTSTSLTAKNSPVVAFIPRYTRPNVPLPISWPLNQRNVVCRLGMLSRLLRVGRLSCGIVLRPIAKLSEPRSGRICTMFALNILVLLRRIRAVFLSVAIPEAREFICAGVCV